MKKLLIILVLFTKIIFALNSTELKLLWWNVENLFDTTDDPEKRDTILSKEEFQNKTDMISKKLTEIDSDIVGLAEIENIFIMDVLAKKSKYPYFYLHEGNDIRGIDVGLLSKYKLEYKSHKGHPTPYKENRNYKFSRDCPEAYFEFNEKPIYLLLNHLKSMAGDKEKSLKKRIAQTKGILDIILSIYESNTKLPFLIIMGDFNSLRNTEPMNILQKSGLKIINYEYNEKSVFTYEYRRNKNDIDYFLMNEEIYNKIDIKEFKSLNTKEFKLLSDHYPLYLEIEFKN